MAIPNQVVSFGFPIDVTTFTYLLNAATTAADVGKAVMLDTAAANTVKLTTDAAQIFGRLETFEDRDVLSMKTGAVSRNFKEKLPAANGHGIVVGDRVVGAAGGLVRKANSGVAAEVTASQNNIVVEVGTTWVVVEKL